MKQVKYLSAAVLLALSGAAQADVTSTITLTSDYDFRGYTQTGESPAVQLSIDYSHESGFYAGIWGSNVDGLGAAVDATDPTDVLVSENVGFSDGGLDTASTEVDVYGGYKMSVGDVGLDFGLTYYTYAGASDLNFAEIYAKASFSVLSGGLFYSNDFGGKATGDSSDSAFYVYADVNVPVGPVTLLAHAGLSDGEGIEAAYFGGGAGVPGAEDSYTDFAAGVSYSASGFTTSLKYVFVDASDTYSDDRIVLSISAGLPLPK
jgi:uncharacterized protein (TIGR02001 family)